MSYEPNLLMTLSLALEKPEKRKAMFNPAKSYAVKKKDLTVELAKVLQCDLEEIKYITAELTLPQIVELITLVQKRLLKKS